MANDEYEDEEEPLNSGAFMAEFFADVKRIRDTINRIEIVIGDVETRHEELLLAYVDSSAPAHPLPTACVWLWSKDGCMWR